MKIDQGLKTLFVHRDLLSMIYSDQKKCQSPKALFLVFFLNVVAGLHAEEPVCVPVTTTMEAVSLVPFFYHYRDKQHSIEQPWQKNISFTRLQTNKNAYSFGTDGSAHWLRFCLTNAGDEPKNIVLAFEPALMQLFDFYPQQEDEKAFNTGNARNFDTRQINHPAFHFTAQVPAQQSNEYYIRFTAKNNAYINAVLWDEANYYIDKDTAEVGFGIFVGIFVGLVLYNLMLFISIRQASSLWFICFASSVFVLDTFFDGRMLQYVFPNAPALSYQIMLLVYGLVSIMAAQFSRSYLKIQQYPRLDKLGIWLVSVFTGMLFLTMVVDVPTFLSLAAGFTMVVTFYYAFVVAGYALFKGSVEARYFLLAETPFIVSVLDRAVYNMGISDSYFISLPPKAGLAGSMILLAYGVGRTLFEDKDRAQQQALAQLEISNNLKSNYNSKLEQEIELKTAEVTTMNRNLEQQAAQLIELNNVKSRFFANVSHEFRTPLTLIQGPLTELTEIEGFPAKETIHNAIRHSKQLQHLIDQLLTLSKFDSESLKLNARPVDLVQLMRYLVAQFDSYAQRESIALNFICQPAQMELFVDEEKLQIVINNLLNNALKFTADNGRIDVELSYTSGSPSLPESTADQYAQIRITDSGCGIPESDIPHIFDRYYQAKNNNNTLPGTGIGLALAKELVDLHVGELSVSSIESVGTRFTISLPLGHAHLDMDELSHDDTASFELEQAVAIPALVASQQEGEVEDTVIKEKILVVDDNRDMRDYLRSLLSVSYTVLEAKDGIEGEAMLLAHQPAIIITDLMMPNRDGLEMIEQIRQHDAFATIPIIMLTAKAGQEDRLKGLNANADEYLAKPFNAKELKVRIQNLLVKHRQMQAFYGRMQQQPSQPLPKTDFMRRLQIAVEDNISDENFSVEQLAKLMFVSTPTLRRRLTEGSSFSPSSFIRHCRLEKARQLVAGGEVQTLSELASAVGFSQASYFSRLYKKTFNCLPLQDTTH